MTAVGRPRGLPAAAILAGGITRHGPSCAPPSAAISASPVDTRPRYGHEHAAPGPFAPDGKPLPSPGPRVYVGVRGDDGGEPCWQDGCGRPRSEHLVVLGETMPRCPEPARSAPANPDTAIMALLYAAEAAGMPVSWLRLDGNVAADAIEAWASVRGHTVRRETITGSCQAWTRVSVKLPGGEVSATRDDARTVGTTAA